MKDFVAMNESVSYLEPISFAKEAELLKLKNAYLISEINKHIKSSRLHKKEMKEQKTLNQALKTEIRNLKYDLKYAKFQMQYEYHYLGFWRRIVLAIRNPFPQILSEQGD